MNNLNCIALILSFLPEDINTFILIIELMNDNNNLYGYCLPILEKIIKNLPKSYNMKDLKDKSEELNEMKKILNNKYEDLEELINNEINDNLMTSQLRKSSDCFDCFDGYNRNHENVILSMDNQIYIDQFKKLLDSLIIYPITDEIKENIMLF